MQRDCPKGKGKGGANSIDETNLGGGSGEGAKKEEIMVAHSGEGPGSADCNVCADPYSNEYYGWVQPWHNDVWGNVFDSFTLEEAKEPEIMEVQTQGEWEKIEVCPDSGAVKFVAPVDMAAHIPWEPGAASRAGVKYRVANGNLIPNVGEKVVKGKDVNGNPLTSKWQGAPVTKPLAGIKEMVRAKNRVVFDEDEAGNDISYIHNKVTKVTIPINDKPTGYSFDMYVPRKKMNKQPGCFTLGEFVVPKKVSQGQVKTHNKYKQLETVSELVDSSGSDQEVSSPSGLTRQA